MFLHEIQSSVGESPSPHTEIGVVRKEKKTETETKNKRSIKVDSQIPELEGIFRESWSDPLGGGGKPKVSGKLGQIQDQK